MVCLLPLGNLEEDVAAAIERGVHHTFGLQVRRLATEEEPGYAYDDARCQFSSELILRNIIHRVPDDALRLLAVTNVDLFIPMLTFVYGQAQLNGRVAVVSTARMDQGFYLMPANRPLLLSRIRKESLHELGHTFGLTHCVRPSCVMSIATGIELLDTKGEDMCAGCLHLLHDAHAEQARMFYEQH